MVRHNMERLSHNGSNSRPHSQVWCYTRFRFQSASRLHFSMCLSNSWTHYFFFNSNVCCRAQGLKDMLMRQIMTLNVKTPILITMVSMMRINSCLSTGIMPPHQCRHCSSAAPPMQPLQQCSRTNAAPPVPPLQQCAPPMQPHQ